MKMNIRCVLRHGLIILTILLCLFAVCATPATAAGVYEEIGNFEDLQGLLRDLSEAHYTIVITDDIDVSETLPITGNVTLTTNKTHPHTLRLVNSVSMFTIESGGKLTICGNNSNELILQGVNMHSNSLIVVNDGTFTMKANSTLTKNNIAGNGGAVSVNGGEFVMKGGTISYNTATYGGAVLVNSGVFVMEDGAISHNTAMYGGGVQVHKEGIFEMSGGEIFENYASVDGEGVIVFGGTFEMSGGNITKNTGGNSGVALSTGEGVKGQLYVKGSAEITENAGKNIYTTTGAEIFVNGVFTGSIGVSHGYQQSKAETIRFATGNDYLITSEDAKHFFADDSINYSVQLREDGLYLVSKITKAVDPPKSSSVWISSPANSKLGSGIIENTNGGTVNFPEGFPFKSVTINQAGEVTQSSPSSAESTFPVSDKRLILASADITASPAIPSNGSGTVTIEFTVPTEKIPQGYAVGVYHRVTSVSTTSSSDMINQNAMVEAKKVIEETSAVIDEVKSVLEKYSNIDAIPSSDLLDAYYEIMDAAKKAKEASQKAGDAERNVLLDDRETIDEAHKASKDAQAAAFDAERLAGDIAEKLGYTPPERAEGSGAAVWKAEKVIETGRSNGLVHYAVEVNSLSPFIIVIEQGGAEPATSNADYVPPLDLEPAATPTESPAPLLGVLAGLGAVVWLRRR